MVPSVPSKDSVASQAAWRGALARRRAPPLAAVLRECIAAAAAAAIPGKRLGVLTRAALAVVVKHADLPAGAASLSEVWPCILQSAHHVLWRVTLSSKFDTNTRFAIRIQVTAACKQLARCLSATAGCGAIAISTPGAVPALLRLVRCCNRSAPHAALLAAALATLKPLARNSSGDLGHGS